MREYANRDFPVRTTVSVRSPSRRFVCRYLNGSKSRLIRSRVAMQSDERQIKQKLVDSALRLFAEHGRDHVSLRDIAADTGVTHGSIRYHFGTKENLYLAALMRLETQERFLEEIPERGSDDRLAREQGELLLRRFIHRFVEFQARMGEDRVSALGLMQAEVSRDGGPDPVFFQKIIKPGHEHLKAIIHRIRPDIDDDKTLEILAFNVIFQCVMIRIGRGTILKLFESRRLTEADVTRIGDLIFAVTVAGLREVEA